MSLFHKDSAFIEFLKKVAVAAAATVIGAYIIKLLKSWKLI